MQQHMSSAPCCFGSVKVGIITDCKMQQKCDDAMRYSAVPEPHVLLLSVCLSVCLIVQRPSSSETDRPRCIFTFGPLSSASSDICV